MEFKLISIASLIAFYGCYYVKIFHQKTIRGSFSFSAGSLCRRFLVSHILASLSFIFPAFL